MRGAPVFPILRWCALLFLAALVPAYWHFYGPANFLLLCDIAIILTTVGLWKGSALLLSTQAVSSLLLDVIWDLDVFARLLLGRHLIGGTEYMWDARWPLWLRLLSLFHVLLPPVLLWGLRRVGYDRRALWVQSAIAALAMAAGRLTPPAKNSNYAFADPFFHRQWGPAPVHVAFMWLVMLVVVYLPVHLLLRWLFPAPGSVRTRGGA